MKNTATKEASFFDQTDIEIPIAYDFLPGVVMKFFMRLQMSKEAAETNQKFLALTPGEREAKDHDNNVNLLANLSTRHPEGVPTYEGNGDVGEALKSFFAGENAMKQKLCVDVLNKYFKRVQPKEYL